MIILACDRELGLQVLGTLIGWVVEEGPRSRTVSFRAPNGTDPKQVRLT